jgi:hypothetical protein
MQLRRLIAAAAVLALTAGASPSATAQSSDNPVQLVVEAGRSLRVALDHRVTVKHVGQPITATLVGPVYAYDRVVLPAGTRVLGHVEKLESPSKKTRTLAMLRGNFSPLRRVMLQFDKLVLRDGEEIPIRTVVTAGTENMVLQVAGASKPTSIVSRAGQEIGQEANRTISTITAPGKKERLKDAAIRSLPYHPDFLTKGTLYTARLLSPLDFGVALAVESAPYGTAPAPDSILTARLLTPIDSATTKRGTPIEAVITEPVFSADRRLILPEGSRLTGAVTYATNARQFCRNGKLRFLFETVHAPDREAAKLLATLHSVQVGRNDRLTVDEEGGTSITNSRARFVAPALASLALAGSLQSRVDLDTDGAGPETEYGGAGSSIVGGLLGFGVVGAGVSLLSHPGAVIFAAVGVVRTVYGSVIRKGREVVFPADTYIQVKLAPGPSPKK